MNIYSALKKADKYLKINNIKSSRLDSEILLSKAINRDRKYIILNSKKKLSNKLFSCFKKLVIQRSKGTPIAYLLEKKEFWKYEFKITKNVLIPRPDTELIIEEALKISKNKFKLKVLDIGVGSGCIILSILKERKDFNGVGIDISRKSIGLSKLNSLNLGVQNRVKLIKTDVDNFNYGKYDLIISNPPYIKKLDLKYLEKDIIKFEPKLALDGGLEGTSEISSVINKSSELIKKNGKFILEIASDQKMVVKRLLKNKGFYINRILRDYGKNDRCIVSTKI
jgi:release factor glutamine methyltransferase